MNKQIEEHPMIVECEDCVSLAICLSEIQCQLNFAYMMNYEMFVPNKLIKKCEYLQWCNGHQDHYIFWKRFILIQKGLL